jgi:predicted adenylyl cyclase CyaB
MTTEKYLTIKEAASILNVHWQTVRNQIKAGKLQAIRFGKVVRIPASQLQGREQKELHEVELRYWIKPGMDIEAKLHEIGAVLSDHNHVIDHYYCPNNIKSPQEKDAQFENSTGYGLRIRQMDIDYSGKLIQTLEVKKLAGPDYTDHSNCLEAEIDVTDLAATEKLLLMLNHKKFIILDKERFVYRLGEAKLCVDTIAGLGRGMEIEIMTSEDPIKVLPKIKRIAAKLDLGEAVKHSLTYEAMEKLAKY